MIAGRSDGAARDEEARLSAEAGKPRGPWGEDATYFLTREAVLRSLGFVYAVAFFSLSRQLSGLIGSHGLLPARRFLSFVHGRLGGLAYVELPSLFWAACSDRVLALASYVGLGLALAVLSGFGNAVVMVSLWGIYLSFVHVGQVFYSFGWELLLLEAGFLAIFLAPPWRVRGAALAPPPAVVVLLFRWLVFRVMFGAGLIKLRGDPCWRALTCLVDHYETQPNPSPLSYYLHRLPLPVHEAGVLFNHFVELVVPWGVFGPRRARHWAGALTILFQVTLIASGNLSFLNWLTIAVALACLDDTAFVKLARGRLRERAIEWVRARKAGAVETRVRRRVVTALAVLVGFLSLFPTVNMISPEQRMNASFDPLHLVNTYGAFGSIEHERHEVVLEGTWDDVLSENARFLEYEFPCKPGDVRRRPCLVTPYHYRLDWQMWFAGLGSVGREPWIVKLVYELLRENPAVTGLLARDPFVGRPPRYVRALLYRYRFSKDRREGWWKRELLGEYLRPLSLGDPELEAFLSRRGWWDGG